MSHDKSSAVPSDAELVAYLDGELSPADSVRIGQHVSADPALAERVATLVGGARPFREAFEPLLAQAPAERLDRHLAQALWQSEARARRPHRIGTALAASLALLVAGAALDHWVLARLGPAMVDGAAPGEPSDDWRRAVAQYLSLYTTDTLSIIADSGAARQQELAGVGARPGLDLTPARVDLPELALKQAEMFDYDGKALAFLAYLDPRSGPVSLCIIAGHAADRIPRTEHRRGMNVVYWSQADHGFMLIGRIDAARLQALASVVSDRFGGSRVDGPAGDRG